MKRLQCTVAPSFFFLLHSFFREPTGAFFFLFFYLFFSVLGFGVFLFAKGNGEAYGWGCCIGLFHLRGGYGHGQANGEF